MKYKDDVFEYLVRIKNTTNMFPTIIVIESNVSNKCDVSDLFYSRYCSDRDDIVCGTV